MKRLVIAAMLGTAACAATAAEGKPETVLQGKTKKQASDAVAEIAEERELKIRPTTNGTVVLERKLDASTTAIRYHSPMAQKVGQTTFTFVEDKDRLRVVCENKVVYNPGRPNEKSMDMTPKGRKICQDLLERIQAKLGAP